MKVEQQSQILYDPTQLRKGTLEGCILQAIARAPTYGYEIVTQLCKAGFSDLTEGTVYPLLLRLERRGLIHGQFRPSPSGPARKYYSVTPLGDTYLLGFLEAWQSTSACVGRILAIADDTPMKTATKNKAYAKGGNRDEK